MADARFDAIRGNLWNGPEDQNEKYQTAVMEQYKLYVDMADRTSNRRSLANTFFLTLNTAVFTLVAAFWANRPPDSAMRAWLVIPLVALLAECVVWYAILRAYRQLGSAKWRVVGALEERLPASPWWRAEQRDLDHEQRSYLRLSLVEQTVPTIFAVTYIAAFVAAVAS